jgi:hypothetical protein
VVWGSTSASSGLIAVVFPATGFFNVILSSLIDLEHIRCVEHAKSGIKRKDMKALIA